MAGFLPNGLPAVTAMPSVDDVLIIQENGANVVSSITYSNLLNKGGIDGVCPLGSDQIIPTQYIPSLSITDVFVVADIASRDTLTVEKGDVVKVSDSDGSGHPQTYIYDGTTYIDIQETSDVISVNGLTGEVSLSTNEIPVSLNKNYISDAQLAKLDALEGVDKRVLTDIQLAKLSTALVNTDIGSSVQGYNVDTVIDADYASTKATINAGGDTASRPASPVSYSMYFDTTLSKPIWFDGTNWVDATGTIV